MSDALFSSFAPLSKKEWEAKLIKDLKGESPASLDWQNENGFVIHPYYTHEDLIESYTPCFDHSDWDVCVKINNNTANADTWLLKCLEHGASSFFAEEITDVSSLLKKVDVGIIRSAFKTSTGDVKGLLKSLKEHSDSDTIAVTLFPNALENEATLADWCGVCCADEKLTVNFISADVLKFHNQGCTAAYEIAIALSMISEYLLHLKSSERQITSNISIRAGIRGDYFVEIAKLRAFRRLWELIKDEFKLQNNLYIIAETSLTNKSLSGEYNNLVRTSVEAMAAVIGGCNELIINPADTFTKNSAWFTQRMAINQQHIIKEESYLGKMADVSCGSFYIESMTDAMADKALGHLKSFESQGGFFACVKKKIFEKEIAAQYEDRRRQFFENKTIGVGVNKFFHEADRKIIPPDTAHVLNDVANPMLEFEKKDIK